MVVYAKSTFKEARVSFSQTRINMHSMLTSRLMDL